VKVNPMVDSKHSRDYKRCNYDAVRKESHSINWIGALQGSACEAWSVFKQQLFDVVNAHMPEK